MFPLQGGHHARPNDAAFPYMPRADGGRADPGSEGLPRLPHSTGDCVPGVGGLPRLWGRDEGAERKPNLMRRGRVAFASGSRMLSLSVVMAIAVLECPPPLKAQ